MAKRLRFVRGRLCLGSLSLFFSLALFFTKVKASLSPCTCPCLFLFFFHSSAAFRPCFIFPPFSFCFHSPATSLKLLHANIPILPSPPLPPAVLHFPTSPSFISLCALRPDRALSPRRGSSALRERLRSSSLANQFPPESVTPVLFFFIFIFFAKALTSHLLLPLFLPLHICRASFSHFAQLRSSAAYLLRLIHHYFHLLFFLFSVISQSFASLGQCYLEICSLSKPPTPSPVPVLS